MRKQIREIKDKGQQAVIPFVMAGFPEEDSCLECIKAMEQGGCDALEIGIPFTDPLADGEVIERLHHLGVARGWNLGRGLEFIHRVHSSTSLPLLLFTYYNPLMHMGLNNFLPQAGQAGVQGIIIPDLPLDQLDLVANQQIEVIPMLAPSSTGERIEMAAGLDPAFIYCVSVRGVTGIRSLPEVEIKAYLTQIRQYTQSPLALGFGISSAEQVRAFKGYADAVVVGSYLAQLMEEYGNTVRLLFHIEQAIAELKRAAKEGGA